MAILNNLVVHGASRFLNTLYANDLTVGGTTTFSTLDVTGAANIAGTLTLSKTQDAAGTSDNKPALIVGNPTGVHLELDTNEIMAKASATTTGALTINNDGGSVSIAPNGTTYMGKGSKIHAADGTFTAVDYVGTNFTGTNATFDSGKITNLMVTDTLRSFKWDIDHVANLGGNFLVTPSIIFESGKTAQVTRSGSTLTISITDSGITSSIGGIAWTANSTIKAAGKINNIAIGNCDGTITSINTSTNTMIIQVTSSADVSGFATTATSYTIQELTVMLTKVSGTNPIGIYMTASDPNAWPAADSQGKASISIYGGTAPGTGMTATTPVARLGYLGGLPAINGVTPSGWGLYTNHGYFSGLIVSNEGKIGDFTISDALYSSTHSAYNTNVDGVYLGSDYISVGKQGAAYLKADGTGKIGRYTFASNGEFTTTVSNNTAGMGNATYAFWAGATSANAANAPFSVTYAGAIKSTSGTIGGYTIDSTSLYSGTKGNSTTSGHFTLTTGTFTRAIDGTSRSNLQMALGAKFGVANDGTLYANGANITNINAGNIKTGYLSADRIEGGSLSIGKINSTDQSKILNDNIEVGGRNLVWDTRWENISKRWSNWGNPTTREIVESNGKRWLHLVTTASQYQGYSQNQNKRNGYGEIQSGDKIIYSYTAYAGTAGQKCTVGCHWLNSSGSIVAQHWFESTLTTSEKRYTSQPFTVPANAVGFNVMIGQGVAAVQNLYISEVKLEKGNKPTDWSPAPEDVDDIEVGGRNLLRGEPSTYSQSAYNVYIIPTTIAFSDLSEGDGLTIQMWDVSVDSNSTGVGVYWGGGYIRLSNLLPDSNGYYLARYTVTASDLARNGAANKFIYIYNIPNGHSGASLSIGRWKIERGDKATDWTPAPEDVAADIEDATKTATSYITYVNSTDGIKVHNANEMTDYVQINSSAISFFRNNSERTKIEDAAVRVGGIGSNIRNVYITNSAVQIRNNTSVLAEYGSTISLYQPGTTTKAVEITGTGLNVANGTLTGSALTTSAGEQNYIQFDANGKKTSETQSGESALSRISARGIQSWSTDGSTVYAQMLPVKMNVYTGSTFGDVRGWYIPNSVYINRLFISGSSGTKGGEVMSNTEIKELVGTTFYDSLTTQTTYPGSGQVAIEGITGYVLKGLGLVTLTFSSFSFASGTSTATTDYLLPAQFRPKAQQDFCSSYIPATNTTNNWGRFYITSTGYIRPAISPTSTMQIRGTFTFLTTPSLPTAL